MPPSKTGSLETRLEGLRSAPPSRLPYQADVLIRSFLLERPAGNVVVYNSPGLSTAAPQVRDLGGAGRLLLNHAHEAMYGDPDLEVIPTPGHTRGTTSYLWDGGDHRFLFTGDFVWIEDGQWKAVVLDPGLRAAYLESLALVRELDFDVLVPWGATEGGPCFSLVDPAQRRARVDAIIARVEAGGAR